MNAHHTQAQNSQAHESQAHRGTVGSTIPVPRITLPTHSTTISRTIPAHTLSGATLALLIIGVIGAGIIVAMIFADKAVPRLLTGNSVSLNADITTLMWFAWIAGAFIVGLFRPHVGALMGLGNIGMFALFCLWLSNGLLPMLFLALGILQFIAVVPASLRTSKPRTKLPLLPAELRDVTSFGTPGSHLEATFGQTGAIGAEGEKMTARVLDDTLLTSFAGAKAFHSCSVMEGNDADVDHIVVFGNKVALIDSKVWRQDSYSTEESAGEVWVFGKTPLSKPRTMSMPWAVTTLRAELSSGLKPAPEVRAFVLVHPTEAGAESTFTNNTPMLTIGSPEDIITEVYDWLADGQPNAVLNLALMERIRGHLKAA